MIASQPKANHHQLPFLSLIKMVSTSSRPITLVQVNTAILTLQLAQRAPELHKENLERYWQLARKRTQAAHNGEIRRGK